MARGGRVRGRGRGLGRSRGRDRGRVLKGTSKSDAHNTTVEQSEDS